MNTFDFWVEEGTFDDYNMWQLNRTYARLGNILETSSGAMLVAASARSLSEDAKTEPYDIFVQVFDPTGSGYDASAYVTTGTRSGIAGNNGDTEVTDYGVQWLTDGAQSGKTVDKIQAVSAGSDTVFVLYELYSGSAFDSTWYMILNGDGSVKKEPVSLGSVRLNRDEDPVYTDGAVQWAMNAQDDGKLTVYCLFETAEDKDAFLPAGDPFDINGDRKVNVTDATALLDLLSSTGAPDLNGDHESNVSDVTALLNHLASI